MIGGMYCSLPACVNSGCQITLKVKPEQSLSQYIGLSVLQQLWPYVHRGRAAISYVFLCVYLSCCLYCALFARPPCLSPRFITALALHSSVTPHLGCAPLTGSTSGQERPLVLGGFKKTGGLLKRRD